MLLGIKTNNPPLDLMTQNQVQESHEAILRLLDTTGVKFSQIKLWRS